MGTRMLSSPAGHAGMDGCKYITGTGYAQERIGTSTPCMRKMRVNIHTLSLPTGRARKFAGTLASDRLANDEKLNLIFHCRTGRFGST